MKKFIIILTVLAMVVSLFAGCGSSGDKDISGSISKEPVEPAAPEQEKEENLVLKLRQKLHKKDKD